GRLRVPTQYHTSATKTIHRFNSPLQRFTASTIHRFNSPLQRFTASPLHRFNGNSGTTPWRLWDGFWDDLNLQNHSVLPSLGRRDGSKGSKGIPPCSEFTLQRVRPVRSSRFSVSVVPVPRFGVHASACPPVRRPRLS